MIRWLALVLLSTACNHKTLGPSYHPSVSELTSDLDHDGMSDMEERAKGHDPLVANVPDGGTFPITSLTLRTRDNREEVVTGKLRGNLHAWLLERAKEKDNILTEKLPNLAPRLEAFDDVNYWAWRESSTGATAASLNGPHSLPAYSQDYWRYLQVWGDAASSEGYIQFRPYLSDEKVRELLRYTYRLVISTPEQDRVYFIHPSLTPEGFLRSRFDLPADTQRAQWRTFNLPSSLAAQATAGKTYVLLYDRVELMGIRPDRWESPGGEAEVLIYFPEQTQLVLTESKKQSTLIGPYGTPVVCTYTERRGRQTPARVLAPDEVLDMLSLSEKGEVLPLQGAQPRLNWSYALPHGLVMSLVLQRPDQRIRLVRSGLALATARVGIIESTCVGDLIVQNSTVPLWSGDSPQIFLRPTEDD